MKWFCHKLKSHVATVQDSPRAIIEVDTKATSLLHYYISEFYIMIAA